MLVSMVLCVCVCVCARTRICVCARTRICVYACIPNPEFAPVTMATFPLKFTFRIISEALVCD